MPCPPVASAPYNGGTGEAMMEKREKGSFREAGVCMAYSVRQRGRGILWVEEEARDEGDPRIGRGTMNGGGFESGAASS